MSTVQIIILVGVFVMALVGLAAFLRRRKHRAAPDPSNLGNRRGGPSADDIEPQF